MINTMWVVVCCVLVFSMQAGFMCLESGLTRSKNSIHIAIKNLCDFGISFLIYWAFGFAFMFGFTKGGWIGFSEFMPEFNTHDMKFASFFLFQALFSGTATTIVSGIVAERMSFKSYIIISILMSGLIYSVFGHWAWNGTYGGMSEGWLYSKGFVDFAGTSVVHSVGGWMGLAAIVIMGSRIGRFTDDGGEAKIQGHNLPMAILGVIILWGGWYGFNGGSTQKFDASVIPILINTTLSGSGGLVTCMVIGWILKGKPNIEMAMNGALAGLVSITAGCHAVSALSSIVIGCIGGLFMVIVDGFLIRLKIDDAIGGVPVHVGAGIWGTMAVALFGDLSILATGLTRIQQIWVQLIGIAVCAFWSFGMSYMILLLVNRFFPLRVSSEEEELGLNITEHDASTELVNLISEMTMHQKSGNFKGHVNVEPFTEVGQIAHQYNQVIDRVIQEEKKSRKLTDIANEARIQAENANIKLEDQIKQLDDFNKIATGRELDMIKLKKKVNDYAEQIGEDLPFDLAGLDDHAN